jgi:hypothetical protein
MQFVKCVYEWGYRGVTPDFDQNSVGVLDADQVAYLLENFSTWFTTITKEEFEAEAAVPWDGVTVPFVSSPHPVVAEAIAPREVVLEELPMDPPIEDEVETKPEEETTEDKPEEETTEDKPEEETTEDKPAPKTFKKRQGK